MAAEKGPMSGFRDMLAEDMFARQHMVSTIQGVYEGYGFTPLKTPALERQETLTGKYGDAGEKLIYKFEDNGGREVAMRYDQTVPLARVVARHMNRIPLPYKRYAVGEVWRGESPQHGRYREFTQFDADTVGTKSSVADAEIVAMMSDAMTAFETNDGPINSLIRVNNRRILDGLTELAGAKNEQESLHIIGIIDNVEKDGYGVNVVSEMIGNDYGTDAGDLVKRYLTVEGTPLQKLDQVEKILTGSEAVTEGVDNLKAVFSMLLESGYSLDKVVFDQTIARGLDYYTGIIYETSLPDAAPKLGSVCSGGRFDNLVEAMGGPSLPAVGTSIGVDRLYDGLKELNVLPDIKTASQAMIANFENTNAPTYMKIASVLRKAGIASEIYPDDVKLAKQLKFANRLRIPYVVFAGSEEISKGIVKIRSMEDGTETETVIEDLPNRVKDLQNDAE